MSEITTSCSPWVRLPEELKLRILTAALTFSSPVSSETFDRDVVPVCLVSKEFARLVPEACYKNNTAHIRGKGVDRDLTEPHRNSSKLPNPGAAKWIHSIELLLQLDVQESIDIENLHWFGDWALLRRVAESNLGFHNLREIRLRLQLISYLDHDQIEAFLNLLTPMQVFPSGISITSSSTINIVREGLPSMEISADGPLFLRTVENQTNFRRSPELGALAQEVYFTHNIFQPQLESDRPPERYRAKIRHLVLYVDPDDIFMAYLRRIATQFINLHDLEINVELNAYSCFYYHDLVFTERREMGEIIFSVKRGTLSIIWTGGNRDHITRVWRSVRGALRENIKFTCDRLKIPVEIED
ncbi:hypothetical protein BDV95DRAFT_665131 [Massariosphaeria phaeospora]|uniref:Uncharacterized protein n=1 Tax=Massariosphaeria phaeospora TaxID=100035 RepID=A0A7C8IBS1_9PLEO|nr:hypothetical protein BDV95DRAFT_665131 [Massariosphaeria phaeospora]